MKKKKAPATAQKPESKKDALPPIEKVQVTVNVHQAEAERATLVKSTKPAPWWAI